MSATKERLLLDMVLDDIEKDEIFEGMDKLLCGLNEIREMKFTFIRRRAV